MAALSATTFFDAEAPQRDIEAAAKAIGKFKPIARKIISIVRNIRSILGEFISILGETTSSTVKQKAITSLEQTGILTAR